MYDREMQPHRAFWRRLNRLCQQGTGPSIISSQMHDPGERVGNTRISAGQFVRFFRQRQSFCRCLFADGEGISQVIQGNHVLRLDGEDLTIASMALSYSPDCSYSIAKIESLDPAFSRDRGFLQEPTYHGASFLTPRSRPA